MMPAANLKPEPPDEPTGLVCPKCECRHFYTVDVRPIPFGSIRRRRECRNCGWRVTTFERVVKAK